ncbi:MAG: SCO family protein [Acidimicrobiia bacterium]|nr:SCO family protein [Acidimicrobiia bacterium]
MGSTDVLRSPKRLRWWAAVLGVALGLAVVGCASDAPELGGIVRPQPLAVGDISLPVAAPEAADSFEFSADEGRLLVVYFGYLSCPDVCPTTMVDLRGALAELGEAADTVDVAFVTVDPERDTPEQLDNYLDHFFDRYVALRPSTVDELRAAEEAFTASSEITVNGAGVVEVAHSATTYVVGPDGTVLVEWAFGTTPELMADDLRLLLGDLADS